MSKRQLTKRIVGKKGRRDVSTLLLHLPTRLVHSLAPALPRSLAVILSGSLIFTTPGTIAWAGTTSTTNNTQAALNGVPQVGGYNANPLPVIQQPLPGAQNTSPATYAPLGTSAQAGGGLNNASLLAGLAGRLGQMLSPGQGSSAGAAMNYINGTSLTHAVGSQIQQPLGLDQWQFKVTGEDGKVYTVDFAQMQNMENFQMMQNLMDENKQILNNGFSQQMYDLAVQNAADASGQFTLQQNEQLKKLGDAFGGNASPGANVDYLLKLQKSLNDQILDQIYAANFFLAQLSAQWTLLNQELKKRYGTSTTGDNGGLNLIIEKLENNQYGPANSPGWKQLDSEYQKVSKQITADEADQTKIEADEQRLQSELAATSIDPRLADQLKSQYQYDETKLKNLAQKIKTETDYTTKLTNAKKDISNQLCGQGSTYTGTGCTATNGHDLGLVEKKEDFQNQMDILKNDIAKLKATYLNLDLKNWTSDQISMVGKAINTTWYPGAKRAANGSIQTTSVTNAQQLLLSMMQKGQDAAPTSAGPKAGGSSAQLQLTNKAQITENLAKSVASYGISSGIQKMLQTLNTASLQPIPENDKAHDSRLKVMPSKFSQQADLVKKDQIRLNDAEMAMYGDQGVGSAYKYTKDHFTVRYQVDAMLKILQDRVNGVSDIQNRLGEIAKHWPFSDSEKAELTKMIAQFQCGNLNCPDLQSRIQLISSPSNPYYFDPTNASGSQTPNADFVLGLQNAQQTCAALGSCPNPSMLTKLTSSPGNPYYVADQNLYLAARAYLPIYEYYGGGNLDALDTFQAYAAFHYYYGDTPNGYVPNFTNLGDRWNAPWYSYTHAPPLGEGGPQQWDSTNKMWVQIPGEYHNFLPQQNGDQLKSIFEDLNSSAMLMSKQVDAINQASAILQVDARRLNGMVPDWSNGISPLPPVTSPTLGGSVTESASVFDRIAPSPGNGGFAMIMLPESVYASASKLVGSVIDYGKNVINTAFNIVGPGIDSAIFGFGAGYAQRWSGNAMMWVGNQLSTDWAFSGTLKNWGYSLASNGTEMIIANRSSILQNPLWGPAFNYTMGGNSLYDSSTGIYNSDNLYSGLQKSLGVSIDTKTGAISIDSGVVSNPIDQQIVRNLVFNAQQTLVDEVRRGVSSLNPNNVSDVLQSMSLEKTFDHWIQAGQFEQGFSGVVYNSTVNLIPIGREALHMAAGMYVFGGALNTVKAFAMATETPATLGSVLNAVISGTEGSGVQLVTTLANTTADAALGFNQFVLTPVITAGFYRDMATNFSTAISEDPNVTYLQKANAVDKLFGTVLGMGFAGEASRAYGWQEPGAKPADASTISTTVSSVVHSAVDLTVGGLASLAGGDVGAWSTALLKTAGESRETLATKFSDSIDKTILLQTLEGTPVENIKVQSPGWFVENLLGVKALTPEEIVAKAQDETLMPRVLEKLVQSNPELIQNLADGKAATIPMDGRIFTLEPTDALRQAANTALFNTHMNLDPLSPINLISSEQLSTLEQGGQVTLRTEQTLHGDQLDLGLISKAQAYLSGIESGVPLETTGFLPTGVNTAKMTTVIGDLSLHAAMEDVPTIGTMKVGQVLIDPQGISWEKGSDGYFHGPDGNVKALGELSNQMNSGAPWEIHDRLPTPTLAVANSAVGTALEILGLPTETVSAPRPGESSLASKLVDTPAQHVATVHADAMIDVASKLPITTPAEAAKVIEIQDHCSPCEDGASSPWKAANAAERRAEAVLHLPDVQEAIRANEPLSEKVDITASAAHVDAGRIEPESKLSNARLSENTAAIVGAWHGEAAQAPAEAGPVLDGVAHKIIEETRVARPAADLSKAQDVLAHEAAPDAAKMHEPSGASHSILDAVSEAGARALESIPTGVSQVLDSAASVVSKITSSIAETSGVVSKTHEVELEKSPSAGSPDHAGTVSEVHAAAELPVQSVELNSGDVGKATLQALGDELLSSLNPSAGVPEVSVDGVKDFVKPQGEHLVEANPDLVENAAPSEIRHLAEDIATEVKTVGDKALADVVNEVSIGDAADLSTKVAETGVEAVTKVVAGEGKPESVDSEPLKVEAKTEAVPANVETPSDPLDKVFHELSYLDAGKTSADFLQSVTDLANDPASLTNFKQRVGVSLTRGRNGADSSLEVSLANTRRAAVEVVQELDRNAIAHRSTHLVSKADFENLVVERARTLATQERTAPVAEQRVDPNDLLHRARVTRINTDFNRGVERLESVRAQFIPDPTSRESEVALSRALNLAERDLRASRDMAKAGVDNPDAKLVMPLDAASVRPGIVDRAIGWVEDVVTRGAVIERSKSEAIAAKAEFDAAVKSGDAAQIIRANQKYEAALKDVNRFIGREGVQGLYATVTDISRSAPRMGSNPVRPYDAARVLTELEEVDLSLRNAGRMNGAGIGDKATPGNAKLREYVTKNQHIEFQSPEGVPQKISIAEAYEAASKGTETRNQRIARLAFEEGFYDAVKGQVIEAKRALVAQKPSIEGVERFLDGIWQPFKDAFDEAYPELSGEQPGGFNPFRGNGWNPYQTADKVRIAIVDGNNPEAAVSAGKSIYEERAFITHLLANEDGTALLFVPTESHIDQFVDGPFERKLAELTEVRLNHLDNDIDQSWGKAIDSLHDTNTKTLNVATLAKFTQVFNLALRPGELGEKAREFLIREKTSNRITIFDEAQILLTDNFQAIESNGNGVSVADTVDRLKGLYTLIQDDALRGDIKEWKQSKEALPDNGTLYFIRKADGSILLTQELFSYYQSGAVKGKTFSYGDIRAMVDNAMNHPGLEGSYPRDQIVNTPAGKPGALEEGPSVPTSASGVEPDRMSQDLAMLAGRVLLNHRYLEDGFGEKVQYRKASLELTRGGGQTSAAADPLEVITALGGKKIFLSGTHMHLAELESILNGGSVVVIGTPPQIRLDWGQGEANQGLFIRKFADGTQDITMHFPIASDMNGMLRNAAQQAGDSILRRLQIEDIARSRHEAAPEGHGTLVAIRDLSKYADVFNVNLRSYLARAAEDGIAANGDKPAISAENVRRFLGIEQDYADGIMAGDVLRGAVNHFVDSMRSITLDSIAVRAESATKEAKQIVLEGGLAVISEETFTGISFQGDNHTTVAVGVHVSSKVLNEQLTGRTDRQMKTSEGYHQGAEIFMNASVEDINNWVGSSLDRQGDFISRRAAAREPDGSLSYPHVTKLLNQYSELEGGISESSTQAQKESALYLSMRINDILEQGKNYDSLAGRVIDLVGLRLPLKGYLLNLLEAAGGNVENPVYKAMDQIYREKVLDHNSDLYKEFPILKVKGGAEIGQNNYENMTNRVKMLVQEMEKVDALKSEVARFKELMQLDGLEKVASSYAEVKADRTMTLAKAQTPLEMAQLNRRFDPYIPDGIATTPIAAASIDSFNAMRRDQANQGQEPTGDGAAKAKAPTEKEQLEKAAEVREQAKKDLATYQKAGIRYVPTIVTLLATTPNASAVLSLARQLDLPASFDPEASQVGPTVSVSPMPVPMAQVNLPTPSATNGTSASLPTLVVTPLTTEDFTSTGGGVVDRTGIGTTADALTHTILALGQTLHNPGRQKSLMAQIQAFQNNLNIFALQGGNQAVPTLLSALNKARQQAGSNVAAPQVEKGIGIALKIAINAPRNEPVGDGFVVYQTAAVRNGKYVPVVVLDISKITSAALLKISSLGEFSHSGVEVDVKLPESEGNRVDAAIAVARSANIDGAHVLVAKPGEQALRIPAKEESNGTIEINSGNNQVVPSMPISVKLQLPLAKAKRVLASRLNGPLLNLAESVGKVEELQSIQSYVKSMPMAAGAQQDQFTHYVESSRNGVEDAMTRLRLIAPQLHRVSGSLKLPSVVKTLILNLVSAKDNATALAAIERYQRAVGDPHLAKAAIQTGLPLDAKVVKLDASKVSTVEVAHQLVVASLPEALRTHAVAGRLSPAVMAKDEKFLSGVPESARTTEPLAVYDHYVHHVLSEVPEAPIEAVDKALNSAAEQARVNIRTAIDAAMPKSAAPTVLLEMPKGLGATDADVLREESLAKGVRLLSPEDVKHFEDTRSAAHASAREAIQGTIPSYLSPQQSYSQAHPAWKKQSAYIGAAVSIGVAAVSFGFPIAAVAVAFIPLYQPFMALQGSFREFVRARLAPETLKEETLVQDLEQSLEAAEHSPTFEGHLGAVINSGIFRGVESGFVRQEDGAVGSLFTDHERQEMDGIQEGQYEFIHWNPFDHVYTAMPSERDIQAALTKGVKWMTVVWGTPEIGFFKMRVEMAHVQSAAQFSAAIQKGQGMFHELEGLGAKYYAIEGYESPNGLFHVTGESPMSAASYWQAVASHFTNPQRRQHLMDSALARESEFNRQEVMLHTAGHSHEELEAMAHEQTDYLKELDAELGQIAHTLSQGNLTPVQREPHLFHQTNGHFERAAALARLEGIHQRMALALPGTASSESSTPHDPSAGGNVVSISRGRSVSPDVSILMPAAATGTEDRHRRLFRAGGATAIILGLWHYLSQTGSLDSMMSTVSSYLSVTPTTEVAQMSIFGLSTPMEFAITIVFSLAAVVFFPRHNRTPQTIEVQPLRTILENA